MGTFEEIIAKTNKLAEHVMNMESLQMNLDYPRSLVESIEIPPHPIFETNELLIGQNRLLQEQLNEIKRQNEALKKQAEDSEREARQNKRFGWISLIVGSVIGIAGIVLGIIF